MHPREQIISIANRIYQKGFTTSTGGNFSVMDESGDIWITPSGIDKGNLLKEDIMCLHCNGNTEGIHKPSMELPFHKAIYQLRPDIKAIIHAHSASLVSFSIVRKIPDINIVPHLKEIIGPVGYAGYEPPGSEKLSANIAEEFSGGANAVIMENHGVVVGGKNVIDAFVRFEALEFCASAIIDANKIGDLQYPDDDLSVEKEKRDFIANFEFDADAYSLEEEDLRSNMLSIAQRAYEKRLILSNSGAISVRLHRNDFIITPADIPIFDLKNDDFVKIIDQKNKKGRGVNPQFALHGEIYRRNPHLNSIIQTQSPSIMPFCITATNLDVRTIPECWILLQDIPKVSYGSYINDYCQLAAMFSAGKNAVIIQNNSIVLTGDSLLSTYERLEVADLSARSLISSAHLGDMVPMEKQQIRELRKRFLS